MSTLRKIGNSTGLSLSKTTMAEAGMKEGMQVTSKAVGETIVISKADSLYQKSMDAFDKASIRYAKTLDILSK